MKDTAAEAFEVLHVLEGTQGSKAKRLFLEAHQESTVLRDMCFAAYGGDVYNAYPTVQFEDSEVFRLPEDRKAVQDRWEEFRALLVSLRDRKVTGDAAVSALDGFLGTCGAVEKKWYRRILEHDLKVGMHTTFSKVWDFKMLTLEGTTRSSTEIIFPGVTLCEKELRHIKKWQATDEFLVEPKLDGFRLLFVWKGGDKWSFFSRKGKSKGYNENLGHVARDVIEAFRARGWAEACLDGEIMGETWNTTAAVKKENPNAEELELIRKASFHAFDVFTPEMVRDGMHQALRRGVLEEIHRSIREANPVTRVKLNPQHRVNTLEEAEALCLGFVQDGFEGGVIKCPRAPYVLNNKRSKMWIKVKPVDTQDVRVTGSYEGKERSKYEGMLGGFNVINEKGQTFEVGGGFTDAQRKDFWARREELVGQWMEIEFQKDPQEVAKGRFPVFVRWREDLT